jgi:hypothetical protein
LGSSLSACDRKAIDFRVLDPVSNTAEADPAERQGWVLRVRGTSRDILRNWDANTYWKGRLEIPLDEAIRTEQNRAGSKTRGPWCWIPGPR